MKTITTIISKVGLISLVALMTIFVSCSKSDDFDGGQDLNAPGVALGGLSGYSTYFEENRDLQLTRSGDALTRAWAIPSGYEPYEGGVQTIAIAFAEENMDKLNQMGHFYKVLDKDQWRTNVEFDGGKTYYLYGFIPNSATIKYNITDRNGANTAYNNGAIMTLQDVPTVMPNDLCVVIGAKHGTDKDHDSGLRMGDFSFTTSQGADGKDYVFLLFDHLYAAIRIQMKVYADYDALRKIKLKSLKLNTKVTADDVETSTTDKTNITIKLHKTESINPEESPIDIEDGITFEPVGATVTGDGMEFWSNKDGYPLTTDFQPFIGHFMPNGVTKLILTSVYDVYDRKGNLIREDCKATNTMVLSNLIMGKTETERGKQYTINLTIKPTYLYTLSEPDLDDPTAVMD